MKEVIINYLKTDRGFASGVQLYHQFGRNNAFKQILNRQGFSDYNHRLLLEELRKLSGITTSEFNAILASKVVKQQKAFEAFEPPTQEEITVFRKQIPEEVRKAIRLRDDYPFLASPDCPEEFKIMVHDMLTAHELYVKDHKRLFDATTGEDLQAIAASVVENYLENRQVWDELNYYKEHGQPLGVHPIFANTDRIKEIRGMTTAEHVKLQKACINNIARTKKKIEEQPEHPNNASRKENIKKWEIELAEVNSILGI